MESPLPFLQSATHKLSKTIAVIHIEMKGRKNVKCKTPYICKIKGTLKPKGTQKIWQILKKIHSPFDNVPMHQPHKVLVAMCLKATKPILVTYDH